MTLFENVAYGLRVRRLPNAQIRARVERTIDLLGLGGMAGRYPADLSGGLSEDAPASCDFSGAEALFYGRAA